MWGAKPIAPDRDDGTRARDGTLRARASPRRAPASRRSRWSISHTIASSRALGRRIRFEPRMHLGSGSAFWGAGAGRSRRGDRSSGGRSGDGASDALFHFAVVCDIVCDVRIALHASYLLCALLALFTGRM